MGKSQAGFTLLETTIALALLCAVTVASIVLSTRRGGEGVASREQVVAFLVRAKAHAETNGDANGNTGATVTAHYEPVPADATTLTLYDGRPFGGRPVTRTRDVEPVRVDGRLSLAGDAANADDVAVFIGTSGDASALAHDIASAPPVSQPACDDATGVDLTLTTQATATAIVLSCATGEIVPDAPASP